jgi:NTE family protein
VSLRGVVAALLLAVVSSGLAGADPGSDPPRGGGRPRLALALGGGGARGVAHIGALRALEEAGLPVDAIAATSIGAIVGAIYASGRTARDLDEAVLSLDWGVLFSDRPDRRLLPVARREDRYAALAGVDFDWKRIQLPAGALGDQRVNRFLIEQLTPAGYAAEGDFDRLPIPFRCVATALDDGSRVVLARGDLARAVRASMSIPIFFAPVEWEGRRLVDGFVVDNLPVDVARRFGAAVVVGVDVSSPPLAPDQYRDALGVANQVSDLLTERRNADFAEAPDVLVRPDLGRHSTTDYSHLRTLIEQGYQAMKAAVPEIRAKLEAAGVAGDLRPRSHLPPSRRLEGTNVAEVVVRGSDRLSEGLLRRTFDVPVGSGLVLQKSLRALDRVQATGLLDEAWMAFEEVPAGVRVVLQVEEAPPNRVEVGAAYTEWEAARGVLRLRNRDTLGFGEETEFLLVASEAEKLGRMSLHGDRLFLAGLGYRVGVFAKRDEPRFFDEEGQTINRARFERRGLDAGLELPLERWGLLHGGFLLGSVETKEVPGLDLPVGTDQVRLLGVGLVMDDLDSLLWPDRGGRLAVEGEWNLGRLGATQPFWRASAEGRLGRPIGQWWTLQADAFVGFSGGALPVYDQFRIGGPYLVPGYHHEELKGPQAVAAAVSLRYRLAGPLRVFVRGGAGNVFPSRGDVRLADLRWGVGAGAVYLSRVGPLALELGVHDGGQALVSLSLGWN